MRLGWEAAVHPDCLRGLDFTSTSTCSTATAASIAARVAPTAGVAGAADDAFVAGVAVEGSALLTDKLGDFGVGHGGA